MGVAKALSTANTMSETGLVGPATVCRDEPNSAATTVGTSAPYRPYSGGSPARVAHATPCGNTTTAPIRPASASAFKVERSTRGHHLRSGNKRRESGTVETVEGVTSQGGPESLWYQTPSR